MSRCMNNWWFSRNSGVVACLDVKITGVFVSYQVLACIDV